jgi:hypothetical protein
MCCVSNSNLFITKKYIKKELKQTFEFGVTVTEMCVRGVIEGEFMRGSVCGWFVGVK